MNIVVAGAGLAGSLLAQGLSRAGIDVTVFEREPAERDAQGYRIHIDQPGDLALRELLPPELYDRVLATAGKRGSGVRVLDPGLRVVQEFLVPETADEAVSGRHLTVDRSTLRRILLTGLTVRHAAPFQRYEVLDTGRVRAWFGDGTEIDADLLVGADGTHSRVRAQLLPHAEVVETGQTEIYGRTALTEEARALTPPAALDGFCTVVGDDGRFVPVAAHEFLSGGSDYVMWVVVAPAERFPAGLERADGAELRRIAADTVRDWHPNLGALIRLGDPDSVARTTIRTAKPLSPWESGPVTLMGDAAHTMVPAGISAAVALRDAAELCRRILAEPGALVAAVHDYEGAMLRYGFEAVAASQRRT
ncbi:FAD-dependent oxidoreductase [Nocardia sp. NPDC004068]|uniref:FAD-dependent oxidoreductase n=1 Tax=Nocardia sp. NPDC004068 TaxID=3364303 RepID=UPI0036C435D2